MPTYVITGASSGLGLEMVKQLSARGEKVYATCRKKACSANGEDYISAVPGDVTIIEGIDVTSDDCGEVRLAGWSVRRGRFVGLWYCAACWDMVTRLTV